MKALLGGILLAVLAWSYPVGTWQLAPPAALVNHPDLWTRQLWLGGLCQAFSMLFLTLGLAYRGGALMAWLGCLGWLGWATEGRGFWLVADLPQAEGQLLISAAWTVVLLRQPSPTGTLPRSIPLACIAVAGILSPRCGFILALGLLGGLAELLAWERVLALLLAIGYGWSGGLSLPYFSLAWLLEAAAVAGLGWSSPAVRWLLRLQAALWLAGEGSAYPLWAAVGALAADLLGRGLTVRGASPKGTPGFFLPARPWSVIGIVAMSLFLIKPGEEWYNRRFLLGMQKARINWAQALVPQSLAWWEENLGGGRGLESRRGPVPTGQRVELKIALKIPPSLPSRSLVPLEAELSNEGNETISLANYRGLRLRNAAGNGGIQAFSQTIPPGAKIYLPLTLETPEPEGEDGGIIQLITASGESLFLGDFHYRTWRRLPPVGF